MADQQLYGGTQPALSTTLLLWRSSAGAEDVPIVEEQHSQAARLLDRRYGSEHVGCSDASHQAKAALRLVAW
jgi:hypothetical protein